MSTITLTDDLRSHLRVLLFEELQRCAETLGEKCHEAHEGGAADVHGLAGDDAESNWKVCGMRETAAMLDLIGWSTSDRAARNAST